MQRSTWLLLAAAVVPFAVSLTGGFVYDDHTLAEIYTTVDAPKETWQAIFTGGLWGDLPATSYYRPLVTLSLLLDAAVFGNHPAGFHLTSLILHTALVWVAFRVGRHITGSERLALAAAVLFAVHPVHVEAVAWISGRGDLLAPFFGLAAWLALLSGGWLPSLCRQAPRSAVRLGAGLLLFAAALLSKESAIAFVPMAALCVLVVRRSMPPAQRLPARFPWFTLIAIVPVVVAVVVARLYALGGLTGPNPIDPWENPAVGLPVGDRLATAARAFAGGLRLLVWPHPLRADYSVPVVGPVSLASLPGLTSTALLVGLATLVTIGVVRAARPTASTPWRAVPVGGALAIVAWLPTSSLGPAAGSLLADRYLVLPSFGWGLAVAGALEAMMPGQPRAVWQRSAVLAAVLAVLLALRSGAHVPVWHDDRTLFENAASYPPVSFRTALFLGLETYADGDDTAARGWFSRSIAAAPGFSRAHEGLARAALRQGDATAALASAREAVRQEPPDDARTRSRYRVLLAETLVAVDDTGQALEVLRAGLGIDPTDAAPPRLLGDLLFAAGRLEPAVGAYREAERRAPAAATVRFNLAISLALLDRTAEAESLLQELARREDAPAQTYFHLGVLAEQAGRTDDALAGYQRFLAAVPSGSTQLTAMADEARRRVERLENLQLRDPGA